MPFKAPLAGLIVIALVVLAAGYMQHGLKNRKMKKTVQADAPRTATGPVTVSEKSWMDDQARLGLNTGSSHALPSSMEPRTSITGETADGTAAQNAETVEWAEGPKLMQIPSKLPDDPEKNWLRVRIGMLLYGGFDSLYEIDRYPSYIVLMDRASIPPDVLQAHENYHNTPDVSGRSFQVLICQRPEFNDGPWALKPGEITKSAWIMRGEFLNLEADPNLGWDWAVRQFFNKWGIWDSSRGFSEDWASRPSTLMAPSALLRQPKIERPDFVLLSPHLLKEQQEKYRRALLPSNARSWLRSHPMSLESADEFPFFRVRSNYCSSAIEATITIDHLSEIKFGICKRCHKIFEKEKKYKMSYCSRSCANAASVARFREKQRKPNWTPAMIAKVLRKQKGAKRDAKGQSQG